jgi:hypothetical protein
MERFGGRRGKAEEHDRPLVWRLQVSLLKQNNFYHVCQLRVDELANWHDGRQMKVIIS